MADNRILIANFRLSRRAKTASLYQYDYGQVLRFLGVSLPNTYEVHFSGSESGGEAVTVLGNADGVTIPDALLATGNTVHAWIFLHDEATDGETEYKVDIPVIRRPKATDAEPTPVQQDVITQAIAALNDGVERVEETVEGVQEAIETALQEAKDSGEFDGEAGYTPVKGVDYFDGADGKDGATGPAGISPTVTVTDIEGGHRITITDADGPHSIDVMNGESGGAVQDVQVNGVSVLDAQGVANVPVTIRDNAPGVVSVLSTNTLGITTRSWNGKDGFLTTVAPLESQIRSGVITGPVISPAHQHSATFYGLAKAAGADMKNIGSATVGVYPEAQKSAISEMLNGSVTVSGTTPTINALPGVRYICGEVSTLDITTPANGIVDVVFESGSTPTVLTVTPPTGMTMKWTNGFDPTALEANTTYEINVLDGCLGVAGTWS